MGGVLRRNASVSVKLVFFSISLSFFLSQTINLFTFINDITEHTLQMCGTSNSDSVFR